MNNGLVAPIIIPFIAAALALVGRRHASFQSVVTLLGAVLHLAFGAWLLHGVYHNGRSQEGSPVKGEIDLLKWHRR